MIPGCLGVIPGSPDFAPISHSGSRGSLLLDAATGRAAFRPLCRLPCAFRERLLAGRLSSADTVNVGPFRLRQLGPCGVSQFSFRQRAFHGGRLHSGGGRGV
jgi:hypothetical protein